MSVTDSLCNHWVLEFVISNITGNNKWENCNSLDFNIRGLSDQRNPRKLETKYQVHTNISYITHDIF
jgi:hypothetical protein